MTLEDFYIHVLRALKVVPPNGTAEAEDQQRVIDIWPVTHAYLLKRRLIDFSVTEAIPAEYVLPLTKIMAYQLVDDFGVPDMQVAKLKYEGELDGKPQVSKAEVQLRKLMDVPYVDQPIQHDSF